MQAHSKNCDALEVKGQSINDNIDKGQNGLIVMVLLVKRIIIFTSTMYV